MEILKAIFLFLSVEKPAPYVNLCERDISHLNHKVQIEVGIGCSTVGGRRVYSDDKIRKLLGEEFQQVQER